MAYWLAAGYSGEKVDGWREFDTIEAAQAAVTNEDEGIILNLPDGETPHYRQQKTEEVALVYDYRGWREPNPHAENMREWWQT